MKKEEMSTEKSMKNGEVGVDIDGPVGEKKIVMPNLPKPLTLEEKKYLLAVERGDLPNVRRLLHRAHRKKHINIDCVDPLGRGALTLAIDGENLEMVELLIVLGVKTKDSLLQAINVGFVEAVELLLEYEELVHKEGEKYSWEKVDWNIATFTPDITPLILAAHRNNYEILKILLDRGATLPMPHEIRCGCQECITDSTEDSLKHSRSRINEYKALASPSLIALSSSDPILSTFELSWDLRNLAFAEQESKSEYLDLRRQCQQFAVDLLSQTRSSQELAIILNHDPDSPPYEDGEHMKLARLELAINYKQKKFVAHPNIQQLLATMWYDGLPGFRRKTLSAKLLEVCQIALLFPFYCMLYMIAPASNAGKLMRKPFMKFLIHASSYLFFLLLLILVSQRVEDLVIELFGTESMRAEMEKMQVTHRGHGPKVLEVFVGFYVLGFIWEETMEIWNEGMRSYLRNLWNFIDFTRNSLYVGVFLLRCAAYWQQTNEIAYDPAIAYIPREQWDAYDPQLIAEGLFAAANVFSALKLVHLFSINPHLGPLQISLGRMVIDIVKFFFIYSLVLFAFACGLNQLLWYFAELERRKCYSLPGGLPDWDNKGDSCTKWRSFGNLFESTQSLFWASFGGVGTDAFQLTGIKTYTRFWGLLMFGSYSVINVIVLLNLLIAMMSNSYAIIDEHSDTEWKFARTKLWLSYFEGSATLPPPFNIFPSPKMLMRLLGLRKKDKLRRMSTKRKERKEKERDYRYTAVMRALVWRYISASQRQCDENPVTEDDVNEIKGEISAMKCEILDVLERNGLDVSSADKKEKAVLGKKMKIWERRLMKDFHVAPVAPEEEMDLLLCEPPPDEDSLSKFRRIAKLAVLNSAQQKWGQVVRGACSASQIGRCNSREAFKNQQCLQRAMQEAQKLVTRSPVATPRSASPANVALPETTGASIMELLHDMSRESQAAERQYQADIGKSKLLDVQKKPVKGSPVPPRGRSPNFGLEKGVQIESFQDAGKSKLLDIQNKSVPGSPVPPHGRCPNIGLEKKGVQIESFQDAGKSKILDVQNKSVKGSPVPPNGRNPSIGLEKKGAEIESFQGTEMKSHSKEAKSMTAKKTEDKSPIKTNKTTSLELTTPHEKSEQKDQPILTPSQAIDNLNTKRPVIPVVSVSPPPCLPPPRLPSPMKSPRRQQMRPISPSISDTESLKKEDKDKTIYCKEIKQEKLEDTHKSFKEEAPSIASSSSYSSQEALIPPSPPEVSTPVHLKGCIKTVKRQPKANWL